jgi:hypothetical protein
MRIRQVRPEFWSDETLAALPLGARLFYIGLWGVADDAGWMEWRPVRIGALLFPYETAKRRQRDIDTWTERLVISGRLVLYDCGCAQIPTLSRHQRVTGKQNFTNQETHTKHRVHKQAPLTGKQEPLSGSTQPLSVRGKHQPLTDSPVTLGNGTEGNVLTVDELHSLRNAEDEADREKLKASRHLRGVPA